MKKLLVVLAIITGFLWIVRSFGGEKEPIIYRQSFPGKQIELFRDKELKVLPLLVDDQESGYRGFYKDRALSETFDPSEDGFNSKYSTLIGKTFKVLNIEQYKTKAGEEKSKLSINNPKLGNLYFDYDPKASYNYPFEVIGGFPDSFYCRDISLESDKFTGGMKYHTDLSEGFIFSKYISKNSIKFNCYLTTTGSKEFIDKKGLIILLSNNNKIEKPNAIIETGANKFNDTGSYEYSTFIELSKSDIKLLSENKITDIRLYAAERTINDGDKLRSYIRCLNKAK